MENVSKWLSFPNGLRVQLGEVRSFDRKPLGVLVTYKDGTTTAIGGDVDATMKLIDAALGGQADG